MNVEALEHLEEFEKRLNKLEKHGFEDTLTLVEILSSITFFGGLKMENCKYSKEGQCRFFFLGNDAKKKIPIATDCRIRECDGEPGHCHLELSNVSCAFCPDYVSHTPTSRDRKQV